MLSINANADVMLHHHGLSKVWRVGENSHRWQDAGMNEHSRCFWFLVKPTSLWREGNILYLQQQYWLWSPQKGKRNYVQWGRSLGHINCEISLEFLAPPEETLGLTMGQWVLLLLIWMTWLSVSKPFQWGTAHSNTWLCCPSSTNYDLHYFACKPHWTLSDKRLPYKCS